MAKRRALSLISGGLDSLLASKLIIDQGVHVEGIYCVTGYSGQDLSILGYEKTTDAEAKGALQIAKFLNIKVHLVDVVEEYRHMLISPKYGYGKHFNPCLDCKIFIINKAYEMMREMGFDFLITGEVVGQRPKSQLKSSMQTVLRETETGNRLLRPLCAKLLDPTVPELEGWVDRNKLLDLSGRNRTPQLKLAESFGFKGFAQPGGGCLLTIDSYSKKLCDHLCHHDNKYEQDDVILLRFGRHLRINDRMKLIVGRNEKENNRLETFANKFVSLTTVDIPGPVALIYGKPTEDDIQLASRITAHFAKNKTEKEIEVKINYLDGVIKSTKTTPLNKEEIVPEWNLAL